MSGGGRRVTEGQVRREIARTDARAGRRRALIWAAILLGLALAMGALAAKHLFVLADIRTEGMAPELQSGDVALFARVGSPLVPRRPGRGDVALVRYTQAGLERLAVRRIVALAGDEVSVDLDGRVTVNGAALEEPYAAYRTWDDYGGDEIAPGGALENPFAPEGALPRAPAAAQAAPGIDDVSYPLTVPEGGVFVLCDDRNHLLDSRSSRFGILSEAHVLGLERGILWPLYRAGLHGGE